MTSSTQYRYPSHKYHVRHRLANHNNAGENLQRQLTAPAHRWRKAWVAPTGQQPEASYRVCRWVKVRKDDKDVDDETNAMDDGDDEDADGDDNDNDNEENDDEDDGDEDEEMPEKGGAGKTTISTPAVAAPAPAPETPAEGAAPTTTTIDDAPSTETVPPAVTAPAPALAPAATPVLDEAAVPAPVAVETTSTASADEPVPRPTAPKADEPTTSAAPSVAGNSLETPSAPAATEPPQHTPIPSNAIELSNTGPNHTEDGRADHSAEAGIEITQPERSPVAASAEASAPVAAPTVVGSLGQNEDKMDIDEPVVEKGEAPVEDAGLVMGEMTPPVGLKELEITEQDQVKEAEVQAEGGSGAAQA